MYLIFFYVIEILIWKFTALRCKIVIKQKCPHSSNMPLGIAKIQLFDQQDKTFEQNLIATFHVTRNNSVVIG